MWVVSVDGFKRAEFRHYCDAADFVVALPGRESETARISCDVRRLGGTREVLNLRLGVWRRERRRQIRRAKQTAKWEGM